MLRQQRTPELVRILVREGCEFVNETLRGEAGVRVSNRSPPLNGHANLGLMRFDRQVRNLIGKIVNTLDGCRIVFLSLHHGFEGSACHYRLTHQPRSPTHWVTARINTTNNGVEKGGAIPTALHIVFARPQDLHWNSRRLCHMNGFHHEVRLGSSPTPEPSTQKGGMDLNLLIRKACGFGCGRTVHRLELRSGPDLARIFSQI